MVRAKPCPICFGQASVTKVLGQYLYRVECPNCVRLETRQPTDTLTDALAALTPEERRRASEGARRLALRGETARFRKGVTEARTDARALTQLA
jgi:hypothetical protein